jgi:carboxylesterase
MTDYAKKFGISKEVLKKWNSKEIYLKGAMDTLIILVPGWSAVTRQVEPLAKKLNNAGYSVKCLQLAGHGTRPEDLERVKSQEWVKSVVKEIKKSKSSKKFNKIIIGGVSMGGNVCLLASLQEKVDGIILIGTPVHLKGHLLIKFSSKVMPLFRKYTKKVRPRNIFFNEKDSYQYFPTKNMQEVLHTIEGSVKQLKEVVAPILILQTKNDFFVTKYSPWIIYKNVSSKVKEMCWIHTNSENHVPQEGIEVNRASKIMEQFIIRLVD